MLEGDKLWHVAEGNRGGRLSVVRGELIAVVGSSKEMGSE